ncbi:MAG: hypothetical protein HQL50_14810 [Magnetococcales bacterium]|nr:hypothetical protein [Magnetococcales bacterium]
MKETTLEETGLTDEEIVEIYGSREEYDRREQLYHQIVKYAITLSLVMLLPYPYYHIELYLLLGAQATLTLGTMLAADIISRYALELPFFHGKPFWPNPNVFKKRRLLTMLFAGSLFCFIIARSLNAFLHFLEP